MLSNILNAIFKINRDLKKIIIILIDIFLIVLSFILAMKLRLDSYDYIYNVDTWKVLIIISPLTIMIFLFFGLYISVIRFISDKIINKIFKCAVSSSLLIIIISQFMDLSVPRTVPFIYFFLIIILIGGLRVLIRLIFLKHTEYLKKNVAVYGADENGRQVLSILNQGSEYNPIMFFENNSNIIGTEINGLRVYSLKQKFHLIKDLNIESIILTSKSKTQEIKNLIFNKLNNYPLEIKYFLNPSSIFKPSRENKSNNIKNLSIEELIGRESIRPFEHLLKNMLNKNILVTGAGGSIGSELCNQIIMTNPKQIFLLDHSEFALYKIEQKIKLLSEDKFKNVKIIPLLGSIQDERLLNKILKQNKIDIIYHAAAYKHVPLVEQNIIEAIKNNVVGTKILSNCAIKFKVKNFILISSDKAVRPTNYMGASKRLAELICQSFAKNYINTKFSIVRFGNVIGSSGSVIPIFEKQIQKGGPITVTDKHITRYFMTIQEAAQLVIQTCSLGKSGDVFILDMGKPIKIMDLAIKMANLNGLIPYFDKNESNDNRPTIEIKITGLRQGEKLYEELFINNNSKNTVHPRIMIAKEDFVSLKELNAIIKNFENCCNKSDLSKIKELLLRTPLHFKPTGKL